MGILIKKLKLLTVLMSFAIQLSEGRSKLTFKESSMAECYVDAECPKHEMCLNNNCFSPVIKNSYSDNARIPGQPLIHCPGTQINIAAESECKKKADCEQPQNSVCYNGRCCPKISLKDGLPFLPYQVNETCEPHKFPVFKHSYSFCDPETKKIWLIGSHDMNGDPPTCRWKPCEHNDNCTDDSICLMEQVYRFRCYENPIKELTFGWVLVRAFFTFSLPIGALSIVIYATIKYT